MKVDYSHENLMAISPTELRAMLRERTHHTLEIQLYEALAKGKRLPASQGNRVKELLSACAERGLPADSPDLVWARALLEMAERCARGEAVDLSEFARQPFDEATLAVTRRLLGERRSVRHWLDQEVPETMIDEVLQAALWAPHGCNLASLRFLVIRERHAPGLFRGADIPPGPVHVVACQDRRVYYMQPGYAEDAEMLENNRVLDCGAAMQNMLLMAHALGLGAVWLTFEGEMRDRLCAHFQLPDYIQIVTYLDLGFPNQTPMPPGRPALEEIVLARL